MPDQVRHDGVRLSNCQVNTISKRRLCIKKMAARSGHVTGSRLRSFSGKWLNLDQNQTLFKGLLLFGTFWKRLFMVPSGRLFDGCLPH